MPLPAYPTPYYWDIGYAEGNLPSGAEKIETAPDSVPEIYPNPFNPIVNIRLPTAAGASELFIYNGNGVLVSVMKAKGGTCVRWDAPSQPSGVYLLKIRTTGKQHVRKIILLK
jgi:hypothetical protein